MALPPLLDKLQKIPTKTRAIAFGALIVVALVVYILEFQIPMKTTIDQLKKTISSSQAKIAENETKIKKLDELKAEVKERQAQLIVLTEQLPPESEVTGLLKQMQNLVNQSGLVLMHWKPDIRGKDHPSGLYREIPIALSLSGGYNNTAVFFDRVGKLTRIVNIRDIKMGSAKIGKDGAVAVEINCTAMTFAAVEKKIEAAKPAKKTN